MESEHHVDCRCEQGHCSRPLECTITCFFKGLRTAITLGDGFIQLLVFFKPDLEQVSILTHMDGLINVKLVVYMSCLLTLRKW